MTLTLDRAIEPDLDGFVLDARQTALFGDEAFDQLHRMVLSGCAMAARFRGRVIGFGGFAVHWPGRAGAWCFLGADIPKPAWVPLTRAVRTVLAAADIRRVEADIREEFRPGARWARMLGFVFEGAMPAFWTDGATYLRFARIA